MLTDEQFDNLLAEVVNEVEQAHDGPEHECPTCSLRAMLERNPSIQANVLMAILSPNHCLTLAAFMLVVGRRVAELEAIEGLTRDDSN